MSKFFVYPDNAGYWRWKLVAANGETIAVSSESYDSKQGAINSAQWVKNNAPYAPIYS